MLDASVMDAGQAGLDAGHALIRAGPAFQFLKASERSVPDRIITLQHYQSSALVAAAIIKQLQAEQQSGR